MLDPAYLDGIMPSILSAVTIVASLCFSDFNVRYWILDGINKRDRFIAELREDAKARGLSFRINKIRGKGGHAFVWVGDKTTALPSREIDPKTARKIRKTLDLE